MDAIVDLSWRVYPAGLMMVAGTLLLAWSARRGVRGFRLSGDAQIIAMMGGFRLAILGLAVASLGAAWLWHLKWLLVIALVIAGEEILESTTYLRTLRRRPGDLVMREAIGLSSATRGGGSGPLAQPGNAPLWPTTRERKERLDWPERQSGSGAGPASPAIVSATPVPHPLLTRPRARR